jgi:hypothetical protein
VVSLLKDAQARKRKEARTLYLQEEKEHKEKRAKHEPDSLTAQQAFVVNCVLPNLSTERLADLHNWVKIIEAVATVFGKSEHGLVKLKALATSEATKALCEPVYRHASASVGLDELSEWFRQDSPDQFQDHHPPECDNNIDEHKIFQWIADFNNRKPGSHFPDQDKLLDKIVRYMNQWICIIRRSTGKPNVIEELRRPTYRVMGEKQLVTHFVIRSPADAVMAYNKSCQKLAGEKSAKNPMERWLRHHASREYDYIDFDPTGKPPVKGMFNLFRGLAIPKDQAVQDDYQASIVTDHVLTIWCRGSEEHCAYLLDWMAHLVQRPGVKMIATPVLKGGQGAGKGVIVQMLGDILGAEHFISATCLETVTGTFQEEKTKTNLLTFLDECTFAGDKKQSSVLKGLLSETYRKWEAKFVNPIRVKNYSNFIVASNYDEIVLVEQDDRRWFCLEVDSKYAGPQTHESTAYFKRLTSVDVRHFAHFLYNRDISNYNPRAIPSSNYHRHQKLLNFDTVTTWLEQVLRNGGDADADLKLSANEGTRFAKKAIFEHYHHSKAADSKYKNKVGDKAFFKKLYALLPEMPRNKKMGPRGNQVPAIIFPPLPRCKELFEKAMHETQWEWDA